MSVVRVNYRNLRPLSGYYFLSDPIRERIALTVDPDDESAVKNVILAYVVPRLRKLDDKRPGLLNRIRDSLMFYLSLNDVRFPIEDLFFAEEPPFALPSQPINYYRWCWEVLFPHEEYKVHDLTRYVEFDDGSAP